MTDVTNPRPEGAKPWLTRITDTGNLISRRRLATDPDDVAFSVYRAGTRGNRSPVTGSTNYFHGGAPNSADWTVSVP